MYLDFHYYSTYTAARLGGMNHKQAKLVATCDQYVDEMEWGSGTTEKWVYRGRTFDPPATCGGSFWNYGEVWSEESTEAYWRKVWIPFHFLPGNFDLKFMQPPENVTDSEKREEWKLICVPNSPLAQEMMNDTIRLRQQSGVEGGINLQLLGARMHVYEDTWSHQGFTGTTNDDIDGLGFNPVVHDISVTPPAVETEDWELGEYMPWVPAVKGFGHARLGRFPDDPFRQFSYTQKCNLEANPPKPVNRNNPKDFLEAFLCKIKVIKCYLDGVQFDGVADEGLISKEALETVKKIIAVRGKEAIRSRCWINELPNLVSITDEELRGIRYNKEELIQQAKKAACQEGTKQIIDRERFLDTDFYKFVKATEHHAKFVNAYLKEQPLSIAVDTVQDVGDDFLWPVALDTAIDETSRKGEPVPYNQSVSLSVGGVFVANADLQFFGTALNEQYLPTLSIKKIVFL